MKKLVMMAAVGVMTASMAMGNWVLNPGFEEHEVDETWNPSNWTIAGSGVWRNDANPNSGDWHLSIDANQDPAADQFVFNLGDFAGQEIFLSVWWAGVGGDGGNLFIGMNERDSGENFLANHESTFLFASDGVYQQYTTSFVADEDMEIVEVYFRTDEVDGRRFDIDDVSLIPEPGTMGLLAIGLMGVAALRRRLK